MRRGVRARVAQKSSVQALLAYLYMTVECDEMWRVRASSVCGDFAPAAAELPECVLSPPHSKSSLPCRHASFPQAHNTNLSSYPEVATLAAPPQLRLLSLLALSLRRA